MQNLTVNATGAFAAYVVTVGLGFVLVKDVESQIQWTRLYPIQGVIDLADNQVVNSNQFYSRLTTDLADPSGKYKSQEVYFVDLLDHPAEKTTVWLNYWELPSASGLGPPPVLGPPRSVQMDLVIKKLSPQHFRLETQGDKVVAKLQ